MAQDPDQVSTAEIRSQIERTRTELGHTIDAIQDRLSPRRVVQEAKETISDATIGRAKRMAHRVTAAVKSTNGSPAMSAVIDKVRNDPAMTALICTAASAVLLALIARSRRPRLAKGLSGLALSLAIATIAQQRQQRAQRQQPPGEPYPGVL